MGFNSGYRPTPEQHRPFNPQMGTDNGRQNQQSARPNQPVGGNMPSNNESLNSRNPNTFSISDLNTSRMNSKIEANPNGGYKLTVEIPLGDKNVYVSQIDIKSSTMPPQEMLKYYVEQATKQAIENQKRQGITEIDKKTAQLRSKAGTQSSGNLGAQTLNQSVNASQVPPQVKIKGNTSFNKPISNVNAQVNNQNVSKNLSNEQTANTTSKIQVKREGSNQPNAQSSNSQNIKLNSRPLGNNANPNPNSNPNAGVANGANKLNQNIQSKPENRGNVQTSPNSIPDHAIKQMRQGVQNVYTDLQTMSKQKAQNGDSNSANFEKHLQLLKSQEQEINSKGLTIEQLCGKDVQVSYKAYITDLESKVAEEQQQAKKKGKERINNSGKSQNANNAGKSGNPQANNEQPAYGNNKANQQRNQNVGGLELPQMYKVTTNKEMPGVPSNIKIAKSGGGMNSKYKDDLTGVMHDSAGAFQLGNYEIAYVADGVGSDRFAHKIIEQNIEQVMKDLQSRGLQGEDLVKQTLSRLDTLISNKTSDTSTCLLVAYDKNNRKSYSASVGDVECYIGKNKFDANGLPTDHIKGRPSNEINQALGGGANNIHVKTNNVNPGDKIIIMSDGPTETLEGAFDLNNNLKPEHFMYHLPWLEQQAKQGISWSQLVSNSVSRNTLQNMGLVGGEANILPQTGDQILKILADNNLSNPEKIIYIGALTGSADNLSCVEIQC